MRKKIGISLRVTDAPNYTEKRDSLSQDWIKFFENLDLIPVLIPNTLEHIENFLEEFSFDGLILSGGDNIGDNADRDKTETSLLNYAIEKKIPTIGVCRGMQLINNFFGGKFDIDSKNQHVAKDHKIEIINTKFSTIFDSNTISVNSFHKNMIYPKNLGKDLQAFAIFNDDDSIEGFVHKSLPIVGVMWHPERDQNKNNKLIISSIFKDNILWEN